VRSKPYGGAVTDAGISIRDFAAAVGLSAHTLRYYERIGLLDPIKRAPSGHRRYSPADAAWVAFLTRLRATGMPISDMQTFAALRREGETTVRERRELLEAHRRLVGARLLDLESSLEAVIDKIHHYESLEATLERPSERVPVRARSREAR